MLSGYQCVTVAGADTENGVGLLCLDCVRREAGNDVRYERWLDGLADIGSIRPVIRFEADEWHYDECENWLYGIELDDLISAVRERDPEVADELDDHADLDAAKRAWWDAGCWEDVPLTCDCGKEIDH